MSPLYLFRAEDGTEREEYHKAGEAPSLGTWTQIDGVLYQRVIEAPQLAESRGTQNYRLHSNALPTERMVRHWEKEAKHFGLPMPERAKRYDSLGRPVFRSTKELADYCKRDGRYSVGNPREVTQESRTKQGEQRTKQLAEVRQREKDCKRPIVR